MQRREISEQEFLDFAKSYFSEAFPNPQRIGCPSDWELIRMSEHPKENFMLRSANTFATAPLVFAVIWKFWAS
jgi:hypothetical protein